jgi:hypothetical protein
MYKFLTLKEAVNNCTYISEESKVLFIYNLYDAIELHNNAKSLESLPGPTDQDIRDYAIDLCVKLKDGIKKAKSLKSIVAAIDRGNFELINALSLFIENSEINLKIEQPRPRAKGRQVNNAMHKLGLSFKSVWEHYVESEADTIEEIKIATLFFIEADVFPKPESAIEHSEMRNTVRKLFNLQLSGKSKVRPYLEMIGRNKF